MQCNERVLHLCIAKVFRPKAAARAIFQRLRCWPETLLGVVIPAQHIPLGMADTAMRRITLHIASSSSIYTSIMVS